MVDVEMLQMDTTPSTQVTANSSTHGTSTTAPSTSTTDPFAALSSIVVAFLPPLT